MVDQDLNGDDLQKVKLNPGHEVIHIELSFLKDRESHGREPPARGLTHSRHGYDPSRLSVADFHRRVLKSPFVASAPGKVPNCYRTSESIYLGAGPIVLRGTLAESLSD